jgi:hypothetical protein
MPIKTSGFWCIGTDVKVVLEGLADESGGYINDATLLCTLRDTKGVNVVGAINVAFNYVATSNGNYEGILPNTLSLIEGRNYDLIGVFTNPANSRKMTVRVRRAAKYIEG